MKARVSKRKTKFILLLNLLLLILCLCALGGIHLLSGSLDSQHQALRWKGDNELEFTQISCFLPVDEKLSLDEVYAFRYAMLDKFHEAALDIGNDNTLFVDAWSDTGKVKVSSSKGSSETSVIAVGGEFFDFHPIRLLSGSYISEGDLMQDRVLLDEQLAWLLYGGVELQGMSLEINGVPFVVAGVIEREQDFASRLAYTVESGLYMSYESYVKLTGNEGISCYEVVMPEPVDGFAYSVAEEKLDIGRGELLENTDRFSFPSLYRMLGRFATRSMQAMGMMYPYWENAARCVEDICAMLLALATICAVVPLITAVVVFIKLLLCGGEKLQEEVFPKAKDRAVEAVRVRQRRRWEKKHGQHEKI